MKIQTVTEPYPIDTIQLADAHGHLWIDPPEFVKPSARLPLNDIDRIKVGLEPFREAGGSLVVDCQPGGCGRNSRMLYLLAQEFDMAITATTGFHIEPYYPGNAWIWSASEYEAMDYFIEEITVGTRESDGAFPATTIKIGYMGKIDGQTRVLMEAAAEASRQTRALLLVHTEEGDAVEELPLFFEDRGVAMDRLYLCHVDKRPDFGLHRELAQAGILLGYDTFIRTETKPEKNVWPLLSEMVNAGFDENIAIGLDMARASRWEGVGMLALPEQIVPRLQNEFSETVVEKLVAQNIAQRLVMTVDEA